MSRYAFFLDLSRCAGCESCTVACQNANGLSPDLAYTEVDRYMAGDFPSLVSTFTVNQCMHCVEAPCVAVCPTGASVKQPEGPVTVDYDHCIGCKYCITACPYDARVFDRRANVVRKCSLCFDRLKAGQAPACVQTCLTGARQVGDLDDPRSPIHQAIAQAGTIHVEGTSLYIRPPKDIPRDVLPANFQSAVPIGAWQALHPVGQRLLTGVAGAVVLSLMANAARPLLQGKEKEPHDEA